MKRTPVDSFYRRVIGGGAAFLVLISLMTGGISAQESADNPSASFFQPIRVPLVNVEVVANNESGVPVRGLTADDFEVFEDGQPVAITHFFAADSSTATADDSASKSTYSGAPSQDLYLTVFLDETTVDPRLRTAALARLDTFLNQPGAVNMRTMLVRFDGSLQVVSDFSSQPEELRSALEDVRGRPSVSGVNREGEALVRDMQSYAAQPRMKKQSAAPVIGEFQTGPSPFIESDTPNDYHSYLPEIRQFTETCRVRSRTSIQALGHFVDYLSGVPGRKAVLWIGDLEMRAGENVYRTWMELFPEQARRQAVSPMMATFQQDISRDLQELVDRANSERVSFFTVGTLNSNFAASASMNTRIFEGTGGPGQQRVRSSGSGDFAKRMMSDQTGGRLLMSGRDLDQQLQRVTDDLGTYYSLAYTPPSPGDGEYHEITVKAKREGVILTHRVGYRENLSYTGAADRTLAAALLGVAENPLGIEVECEEAEPREEKGFLVPVRIQIPIGDLVLAPQEGHHTAHISVFFVISDESGRASEVYERAYPIDIANDQLLAAVGQKADFVVGMLLSEGPHRIAVSVRDDQSSTESTTFIDMVAGVADEQVAQ